MLSCGVDEVSPTPAAVAGPAIDQILSARTSPSAAERPLSVPKAKMAEKAATSTERSILFLIVGFVLT
jgi:hypothetical protein